MGCLSRLAETGASAVSDRRISRRAIFSLIALVELVADKLPQTPSRTAPPGLIARIVMGALTGACIAGAGGQEVFLGAILGAVGGVVGCFLGYRARTGLVNSLGTRDLNVALVR